jgi:predicted MPP superfamily phosphohydrolase
MKLKQLIMFLGIIEGIFLVIHALIYLVVIFLFNIQNHDARVWIGVVFGVLSAIFLLASLFSWKSNSLVTRIFYRTAATWTAFSYFAFLGAVLSIVLYAFLPIDRHAGTVLAIVLFSLAVALASYSVINAEVIRVTRRVIKLPTAPEFWKSNTMVFISDIHLGHIHGAGYSRRIVKRVNELNPKVLLIGGDIFDGPKINAESAVAPFEKITAPLGTYFISGNHDEFRDSSEYFKAIRDSHMRILDAETVNLNGINITGVEYLKTNTREKFEAVIKDLQLPAAPNILLKHVPSDLDIAAAKGFDASFSGHTHNGQMYPFGYLARRLYGFNYGLEMLKSMSVMVSSGVGTWGPPGRFGTRSEIVVISFT